MTTASYNGDFDASFRACVRCGCLEPFQNLTEECCMNQGLGACIYVTGGPTGDGNEIGDRLAQDETFVFFDEGAIPQTLPHEPQEASFPWYKQDMNLYQLIAFFDESDNNTNGKRLNFIHNQAFANPLSCVTYGMVGSGTLHNSGNSS